MMKVGLGFAAAAFAVLFSGCSLLSPRRAEVREIDLVLPPPGAKTVKTSVPMQTGVFRNASGAGQALLHREAGNVMRQDAERRLYQPVENLIARETLRYFGTASRTAEKTGTFLRLSGTLLKFEIDHVRKCAVLEMAATAAYYESGVERRAVHRLLRYELPLKEDSPAGEEAALEACLARLLSGFAEMSAAAESGLKNGKN